MNKTVKQIRNILTFFLIVLLMAVCKATSSFSITIALSVFLFMLMLPIVNGLEKARVPSFVAVIIATLIMVVILLGAVWFLIYAADILVNKVTFYSSKLEYIDGVAAKLASRFIDVDDDFSIMAALDVDWLNKVVVPVLKSVSASAINILKQAAFTMLMAVFLLLEKGTLVPKITLLVNPDSRGRVEPLMKRINMQVSKYLALKVLVSLATGACCYLVCRLVGMDLALVIGVVTFLANFIPTFGSIAVTVVTVLVAIVDFLPNWTPILIVAAGTTMTQMVIGNIIDPRLQGSQLDLSPFVILASLSIFGYIWGIVGMLIAVPILSVIQIMLANMEETQPLAMLLGSGKVFSPRRRKGAKPEQGDDQDDSDYLFPDEK